MVGCSIQAVQLARACLHIGKEAWVRKQDSEGLGEGGIAANISIVTIADGHVQLLDKDKHRNHQANKRIKYIKRYTHLLA